MPNDNWKTPNTPEQPIIKLVLDVIGYCGKVDLDPTADDAKSHIPARKHYNKADNSLRDECEWRGTVFMNPPFSKPVFFFHKFCEEFTKDNIQEGIILAKSGVVHNKGTGRLIEQNASAICLWGAGKARRIAYLDGNDQPVHGADFDSVLIYFGEDPLCFTSVFSNYGNVVRIQ